VLVMKNCGPKGYPGMAEVGNMGLPPKLLAAGVTDMVRISDARMSGTAYGTVVLHVAPEAMAGGPLGIVKDGDWITLDCAGGLLNLEISDEEMAARLAVRVQGSAPGPKSGYQQAVHRPRAAGRRRLRLRLPGWQPRLRRTAPLALRLYLSSFPRKRGGRVLISGVTMLLVQFKNEQGARRVGVLEQATIRVIDGYSTTYALAQDAIRSNPSASLRWPTSPSAAPPLRLTPLPPPAACWRRSIIATTPTATSPAPA
jgi:hypothetical protein